MAAAEGIVSKIEKIEELTVMNKEGIDYIQGYYYSRPIPVNEFISFMRQHNC